MYSWQRMDIFFWYMGAKYFQEFGPRFFDMFLEPPGTGGTSIRLSLHKTNETYPAVITLELQ